MMIWVIGITALVVGMAIGSVVGDQSGYERGCQETHDYYRAREVRR